MDTPTPAPVLRRRVCYLSGFDPQGPAHYHQLYATQAALQSGVNGWPITVGPRRKAGPQVAWWNVTGEEGGHRTETRYEFLRWDDIVREHWPRGRLALLRSTAWASWRMLRNGVMAYTLRRSWPMFLAMAMPGLLLLGLGLGGALLALLVASLGSSGQPLAAIGCLLLGLPLLAWLALVGEARTHMAWLMRSMACLVRQGEDRAPTLEQRLDTLAAHVAEVLRDPLADEVLVVGHSSGALMAVCVLARALAQVTDGPRPGQSWALLTLGHCSPMLSRQAAAARYRAELRQVALDERLDWLDAGAPPDGCCYALVDPTEGLDVPPHRRPRLVNPRFAEAFDPARYQAVRSDKFRCHFQYLMATDRPTRLDYFALTAGSQSLRQRTQALGSVTDYRAFTLFGGPR